MSPIDPMNTDPTKNDPATIGRREFVKSAGVATGAIAARQLLGTRARARNCPGYTTA